MMTIMIPSKMGKQIRILVLLKADPQITGVASWIVDRIRKYHRRLIPDLGTILKARTKGPYVTKIHLFHARGITHFNRDYPTLEDWTRKTSEAFGLSNSEFVRRFAQYWIDRATSDHRDGGIL